MNISCDLNPRDWSKLFLSVSQALQAATEYQCVILPAGTPIHAKHVLIVKSHEFRAQSDVTITYRVDDGEVGIADHSIPPKCRPNQKIDKWQLTLPPAYYENDVVTVLCWRPNDNEPDFNLSVDVDVSVNTPQSSKMPVHSTFSVHAKV